MAEGLLAEEVRAQQLQGEEVRRKPTMGVPGDPPKRYARHGVLSSFDYASRQSPGGHRVVRTA
jgi:hypothetical protein